ncbi:uncharacterized protein [Macrobrachium rosenbergii]|uniref:uncharacterized protein n=1 Tax=Macrobrachium rosenbergii TaxID=79674 RepID=UPI0034D4D361
MLVNLRRILAGCLLISSCGLTGAMGDSTISASTEVDTTTNDPVIGVTASNASNVADACCNKNEDCLDVNSHCLNCTCSCNDGYVPSKNVTFLLPPTNFNGTCLPLAQIYVGQNCSVQEDCAGGLLCRESVCSCPSSCKFRKTDLSCDCAPWEMPDSVGTVIAVLSAVLIMMFWYFCFRERVSRFIIRRSRSRPVERRPSRGISTLGAAYGTDHIRIQPWKSQTVYSSPFRNPQTIAPVSPHLPGYNPYGYNLQNAYHSSLLLLPPPYSGPATASLPAYPYHHLSDSTVTIPYVSMAEVCPDDDLSLESREGSQADALDQLSFPIALSTKCSSSAPGSHVEMIIEGLRPNRSARF